MLNICIASQRFVASREVKSDVSEYKIDHKHSLLFFAVPMTSDGQIISVYRQTRLKSALHWRREFCSSTEYFVNRVIFIKLHHYSTKSNWWKSAREKSFFCKNQSIESMEKSIIGNYRFEILISALFLSPTLNDAESS